MKKPTGLTIIVDLVDIFYIGSIDMMPYELMLKTLGHIEIGPDGTAGVIFLARTRIEVDIRSNKQGQNLQG